jgi:hypothetical protein
MLFKENNYPLDRHIKYLEIKERQKYNYNLDKNAGGWNWTQEEEKKYNSEWNEIIDMLNVRRMAI